MYKIKNYAMFHVEQMGECIAYVNMFHVEHLYIDISIVLYHNMN